jgi:hypothetical protein
MKIRVRQISQGVEDLSWRNMKATTPERDCEKDSEAAQPFVRVEENGVAASRDTRAGDSINGEITIGLVSASLLIHNRENSQRHRLQPLIRILLPLFPMSIVGIRVSNASSWNEQVKVHRKSTRYISKQPNPPNDLETTRTKMITLAKPRDHLPHLNPNLQSHRRNPQQLPNLQVSVLRTYLLQTNLHN